MHIKQICVFHFVLGDNVFKNMYNKQNGFISITGHFFYIFINIYDSLAITTENDSNMFMVDRQGFIYFFCINSGK